ncbi:penicillin-binding protein 2 [uncultured Methylovirgula sp.]|uniref:peptidoglycan D,D-transpeptidase FtsI family protein n=1 Tax=uncultured Methylovirgula sp. TaxID=1285960 RepID=UPI002628C133|nr:penicillin-binding protein 2 [uncultured Methylovirgula sp.]
MTETNEPYPDDPGPAPRRPTKPRRGLLAALLTTKLDKSTRRIRLIACGFVLVYCVIGGKLVYFAMHPELRQTHEAASDTVAAARPDILDRNGAVLATDIKVTSVFAEPRRIIDRDEAVDQLTSIFPDLNARELTEKLSSHKGFVWVKRAVTPAEQQAVYHLGLPGIGFQQENKRVYPNGPIAAHVLGYANIDGVGISGLEKYIDGQGLSALQSAGFNLTTTNLKPIVTSLDLNATYAVRDELAKGIEKFKAKAGAAAILDVNTGEVIALASLPDFDPNNPVDALDPHRINRLTVGVYEMGSTFKALSIAMALDAGKVTLNSKIDARESLRYGRFTIHDFEPQHRFLSVPEVFTYSSNIGTARMAMMVGVDGHKAFLRKMGQLTRLRTELPESAPPLVPKNWGELNTMTIAFGQGLNVAPLQALMAVGALVNGGLMINPTFLKRSEAEAKLDAPRVVKPETSESLRYLMRLNAQIGTAKNANIDGYFVGGKTGTADKIEHGHYSHDKVLTTFMAIVPADKPKYLFFVMLDEPQAIPGTYGFHTAAWNSGAVAGKIVARVGPLLGIEPRFTPPSEPFPLLAQLGYAAANSAVVTGSH